MGRLHRRFIRCHEITVTHKATINKVQAIDLAAPNEINVLNPIAEIAAGVSAGWHTRAMLVETTLNALSEVHGYWEGMRISMAAADDAVIAAGVSCLHINNYIEVQPTSRYTFLDLRENAPVVVVDCAIYVSIATDITDLLVLKGNTTAWHANTPAPGANVGRIAVNVGGVQRYIPLFAV